MVKSALPDHAQWPTGNGLQHLVTLSSIEDGALGEELQVIWELEPGTRIHDKVALPEPTGFDDPARLDVFLDAVRWGAASTANVESIQSPFRSGIEIEDYQLDPVVRAVQMPRVNLLIADDVGLGKTIEAGLVILELLIRHRGRRVFIVCPASLQVQWRDQMRDKFGFDFQIVDSDLMKQLRCSRGLHVNPWTHAPRLITSFDFLKRDRQLRLFRDVLPQPGEATYPRRFDMLVVDEAHNIAPMGHGRYATDSLRTEAIRLLAPHFEHKLFLTATPHNGYRESFTALLELLDSQRFACGIEPDRNQLRTVMVRRLKSELPPRWDGSPSKLKDRTFRAMFHLPTDVKPQKLIPHRSPRLYCNPVILAQEWQQALNSGEYCSQAEFARRQGISRARVTQVLQLLKLAPEVVSTIAALGHPLCSRSVTERVLRSIVHRSADEQRQEMDRILAKGSQRLETSI